MLTAAEESVDMTVKLPADVYQDQFDFVELVRDVTASIENQSSDDVVRDQVQLLLSIVGRDLLKLHTLVEVVNTKMQSQSGWATIAAVKFYQALFDNIDPTRELEVFCDDSVMGADIAAKYILEVAGEFIEEPNWGPGPLKILKFSIGLLRACSSGEHDSAISGKIGCSLLESMAKSLYLPFHDNYDTFSFFAYDIVPLLDIADTSMKSSRVTAMLETLKNEDYMKTDERKARLKQMYTLLGRSDLYQQPIGSPAYECVYDPGTVGLIPALELEQEVATSLELFSTTPSWKCAAIERLLNSISQKMKIDAPFSVQTTTLNTIEAIVRSEYLFLHTNLQIAIQFIFSVAPALDGMADTCQSARLTSMLAELSVHRNVQTVKDRSDIDGLCRNLGRPYNDEAAQVMDANLQERDLSNGVSSLGID